MPKTSKGKIFEFFVISGLNYNKGLVPFTSGLDSSYDEEDTVLEKLISPLQQTYQASVLHSYPIQEDKLDHQALTTLCFPHGVALYECLPEESVTFHPFIITRENGSKVHAAALTFFEKVHDENVLENINSLCKDFHIELQKTRVGRLSAYRPLECVYASKCLCLVMSNPFHIASEAVLRHMHSVAMKSSLSLSTSLPVDSYVYNLLYEVPLPSPGRSTRLFAGKKNIICYRPSDTELPMLDYPLCQVISILGIEQTITMFKCAMLEQRILITGSKYDRLMMVSECLTTLLFPFSWAHVYVPILPASMHHFLDAPVPYIMGLYRGEGEKESDEEVASCEMCIVDTDKCIVEPPEELPPLPHLTQILDEISDLCHRYNITLDTDGENTTHTEHDSDSGMSSESGSSPKNRVSEIRSSHSDMGAKLGSSSRLAELEAIVKRAGVKTSMEMNIREVLDEKSAEAAEVHKQQINRNRAQQELNQLKFSECVREVFFNLQLRLFSYYEKFVIYPSQCDMSSWLCNREMMSNYDKEAFLGDQSAEYQPFLCPFLETQMFATFIDNKIMSQWHDPDKSVKVFDLRNNVKVEGEGEEDHQKATYERFKGLAQVDAILEKRRASADYVALAPHIIDGYEGPSERFDEVFPDLNPKLFTVPTTYDDETEEEGTTSPLRPRSPSGDVTVNPSIPARQPITIDRRVSTVNETYLQFVNTLLKECKVKTKRILVVKMGEEAVSLGHSDHTLIGLEENTMIASLCDLLERIWSHGLIHKQGKSPLWHHLEEFSRLSEMSRQNQMVDTFTPKSNEGAFAALGTRRPGIDSDSDDEAAYQNTNQTPDVGSFLPSTAADQAERTLTHRRKGSHPERPRSLDPLPDNLITDIRRVQQMKEIKTDIGRARAFIRLALERKLLAKHVKELLYNHELLRSLYKRVAFLRCEDEREQALYHLLSLNTADFKCFTNAFGSTGMAYRVLVFPGKRFAGGISQTTANVWVSVAGKLRDSDRKWLPRNCYDFTFESKNLGHLSTVRIGHDNSGMAPKWLVDHVIVRNETTGHISKFPCGRWLGRGVDDDSTERILVGETIPYQQVADAVYDLSQHSPRRQKDSPKPSRRPSGIKKSKSYMQQVLSDSVNNLLKYFHKPDKERESVTILLCGETGLVSSLELMLSMGFKSSRLFRNNLYIWDYLESVQKFLIGHDTEPCRSLVANVTIINNSLHDVGKDGKLQLLLCIAVRDHLLSEWLTYLHYCPITKQMYDDSAYILDEPQVQFLVNLLSTLRSYHIKLEPSITKGLDI